MRIKYGKLSNSTDKWGVTKCGIAFVLPVEPHVQCMYKCGRILVVRTA